MNTNSHIEDIPEDSYTDLIAIEMAQSFEDNSGYVMGNVYLTQDGMDELADLFEDVPIPLRGIVYSKFITELESRGIPFDREQFKRPN